MPSNPLFNHMLLRLKVTYPSGYSYLFFTDHFVEIYKAIWRNHFAQGGHMSLVVTASLGVAQQLLKSQLAREILSKTLKVVVVILIDEALRKKR